MSEIVYTIPSTDIFLSMKNWYWVVFKNISMGGSKVRSELKNKCKKITDISNTRRNMDILSANLAFESVKKVIPNMEYSLINIIKIDKKESILVIIYLQI